MVSELKLAKTCSTCKHAKFKSGGWWSTGRKQMGICMVFTEGDEPALPSESSLYNYAVKHGKMMDLQDFFNEVWVGQYERALSVQQRLKNAAEGHNYEPDTFYSIKTQLNSSSRECDDHKKLTLDEYKTLNQTFLDRYDPLIDVWNYINKYTFKNYSNFEDNFNWWQANKMKMRRCHRATTCDLHEEAPSRENIAKAIVNGSHQLEWLRG